MPSLVRDISSVGGVACGSAHTLAVSVDGKTVWSFGGGDNGKLGHGDTSQVYRPKVIEALQGLYVRKVAAGSTFSLALTSNGQVLPFKLIYKHCLMRKYSRFGFGAVAHVSQAAKWMPFFYCRGWSMNLPSFVSLILQQVTHTAWRSHTTMRSVSKLIVLKS